MCFGKIRDYNGEVSLTFFENVWKELKDSLKLENVYAFEGKVDTNPKRESKSLLVEKVLDPNKLEERAMTEVHIKVKSDLKNDDLFSLKEFFFGTNGNCAVFLHIDAGEKSYTVRAASQITAPASKEFLEKLKSFPLVRDAWTA